MMTKMDLVECLSVKWSYWNIDSLRCDCIDIYVKCSSTVSLFVFSMFLDQREFVSKDFSF